MKTFIAKAILFLVGFALGCVIDLVPTFVADAWRISSCAEDCPPWVTFHAVTAYLVTPFAAGATMVWGRSIRQRALWLLCITLIPLSLFAVDFLRHSKHLKQLYFYFH